MHRAFALTVLARPRCGGRLPLLAPVHDLSARLAILADRGLAPAPGPPRRTAGKPNATINRQTQILGEPSNWRCSERH